MKYSRAQVVLAVTLMCALLTAPTLAQNLGNWSTPDVLNTRQGYVSIDEANLNGDGYTDLMTLAYRDSAGPNPESVPTYWTFNPGGVDPLTELVLSGVHRPDGGRKCAAYDMDGDGDDDMLLSHLRAQAVGWYGNDGTDSPGGGVVALEVAAVQDLTGGDFDDDGDADVFFASRSADMLYYASNNGDGTFTVTEYPVPAGEEPNDLEAADVDGDGDLDVLVANEFLGGVLWAQNDGAGNFTVSQIFVPGGAIGAIDIVDVDNDGDYDLVAGMNDSTRVVVAVQTNARFDEYVLDDTIGNISEIQSGDVDGDGDMDVVVVSGMDGVIATFENLGGGLFNRADVTDVMGRPTGLAMIDLDLDDDLDYVTVSPADGVIAYYTESTLPYVTKTVMDMVGEAREIHADDMDLDGDMDILVSTMENEFLLLENMGFDGWMEHVLVSGRPIPDFLTMDWDDDGMVDIIAADYDQEELVFWRQTGGLAFTANPLAAVAEIELLDLADIDDDGLMDIVVGMATGFNWYDQVDPFNVVEHQLTNYATVQVSLVKAGDWTGDGYPDLMTGRANGPNFFLTLFVNDGAGNFATFVVDDDLMTEAYFNDYNGDTFTDVSTGYDTKMNWYRNNNPGFTAFPLLLNNQIYNDHCAADWDLDGDIDLLPALESPTGIFIWENDGAGNFDRSLISTAVGNASTIFPADMDGDGDTDLVVGQEVTDGTVFWIENQMADFVVAPLAHGVKSGTGNVASNGSQKAESSEFAMLASPNPFNAATTLNMTLPQAGELTVQVFDITGRLVTTLADGTYNAGSHRLTWNAQNHASGVYFVRASALGQTPQVRKIMLVR